MRYNLNSSMGYNDKQQQQEHSLSEQQLIALHALLNKIPLKTPISNFEQADADRNITITLSFKKVASPISFQLTGDENSVLESEAYKTLFLPPEKHLYSLL